MDFDAEWFSMGVLTGLCLGMMLVSLVVILSGD